MAVIGIGTTSRASVEDVLAIIAAAKAKMAEKAPLPQPYPARGEGEHIRTLATLSRAAINSMVTEAAHQAGLDLVLLTLDELRALAHLCVTHSEQSVERYGIPSIAEAAALAAAGAGARLLLPRFCGRSTAASVAGAP